MAVIECVPNVSEAVRADTITACSTAITRAGAVLLDIHADDAHNRAVFTIAGDDGSVVAASHALVATAVAAIDLRAHRGVHPRIGAIDVVPFVPLGGATLDSCIAIAREFAALVAARHALPIFLYEAAAAAPHRRRLEDIRRGGLDALASRMQTPEWAPDFGPAEPHPTAGVTVVGARMPLIAFNINLATDRIEVASAIARSIRESSGGLPAVKALGLPLADRRVVQVSMNLTDYRQTSMRRVFDVVAAEAAREGIAVIESEIVGLVPADALTAADAHAMRVRDFHLDPIIEHRLAQRTSAGISRPSAG